MKKKITLYTLLLILIGVFTFNLIIVKADSGWDSDYDFGGSSSYDFGDSSWSSSDYSYDSGSGGSMVISNSDFAAFMRIIFIIVVIIVIFSMLKSSTKMPKEYTNRQGNSNFKPMTQEEVNKILPSMNLEEFLNNSYQSFIDVQNAWMNFDYDKLRELLSDELFNSYKSQLKVLSAKKQKNIMSDFNKTKCSLTNLEVNGDKITANVALSVSFHDYVVDKDEKIVRGNKDVIMSNTYDLTFVSTVSKSNGVCPNCGAKLSNKSSNVCEYCLSTIVLSSHDWILSKKQIRR